MTAIQLSDEQLWRALRSQASQQAFSELFHRYIDIVYNFCFRRLADWALADEATQATFVALWQRSSDRRLDPLRGDTALGMILWQARMCVLDAQRARGRHVRIVQAVADERVSSRDPIDQWVESEANQSEVQGIMSALPKEQRDVVELVCWAELSMADAAVALGIPVGTVKSRLSRARLALRDRAAHLAEGAPDE